MSSIPYVLSFYKRADAASETLLAQKIAELRVEGVLSDSDTRCLDRLKEISALRGLVFGSPAKGRFRIRQAFAYANDIRKDEDKTFAQEGNHLSIQDITESAIVVADLYWKLYDTCLGGYPDLTKVAKKLFAEIFNTVFEPESARNVVSRLTDSMQRDAGVPFLILNLIRQGRTQWAREIAQNLLTRDLEIDEEIRSSVYWLSEIHWFATEKSLVLGDFDTSIRYLYHLCFTNQERAGFLEIDSRFFSQFETVNELAREGFLFKESLFEKLLALWENYEGLFDGVYCTVLETMTRSRSKIYQERENWISFWKRERENFLRDYLYLVEGNLSYAEGHYEDARSFYEKALKHNPALRAAQLNLVFAYAKLGEEEKHAAAVDRIVSDRQLLPSALYVAGNSYLLLGNDKRSDEYYKLLARQNGWERKSDYYKSTFCFENGLFEKALEYARRAHQENPHDTGVSYHLSLCYNALGEKDQALDMVKRIDPVPEREATWLSYYRFQLERDAGKLSDASETLLKIPSEYFQDNDELEEALEFARGRKDLVLLRHLRSRNERT